MKKLRQLIQEYLINDKLQGIRESIMRRYDVLCEAINTLYKEEPNPDNKTYELVPALLLCFCFLDFLSRIDYIFKNGKDGKENLHNKQHYIDFLNIYLINNNKYKQYGYSFTSEILYNIRCDLAHSFNIKNSYVDNGSMTIFMMILPYQNTNLIQAQKTEMQQEYHEYTIEGILYNNFLEIIHEGLISMLDTYELSINNKTNSINHLNVLLNDLEDSPNI